MSNRMQREATLQQDLFPEGKASDSARSDSAAALDEVAKLRNAIPSVYGMDGFPEGQLDDILRLSLPPAFTACPNPFLDQILDDVNDEEATSWVAHPLTQDISAGKSSPIYFAHYYSTKVPPEAITPYVLHYTKPGDVVLDAFCGTGMTGVGVQLCSSPHASVLPGAQYGERKVILADLSPAATFIAAITNRIASVQPYLNDLENRVREVANTHRSLFETRPVGWPRGVADASRRMNSSIPHSSSLGHIEYVVWSDVFNCAECGHEMIFWDLVFLGPKQRPPAELSCPSCGAAQSIRSMDRAWTLRFDHELGRNVRQAKQVPVLINYSIGSKRFEKTPDSEDLAVIAELDATFLPYSVPVHEMPEGFNTAQPRLSHGFTHVHHFFTRRNVLLMSALWERFRGIDDPLHRCAALFVLTGMVQRVCRLNRYMPSHDRHVGPLSGTLYVSQLTAEIPATNYALDRIGDLRRCADGPTGRGVMVSTQSATNLANIPNDSVDYVFTDPPFGGNLNYSELNTLVEAWLGVWTNNRLEAVVNQYQGKSLRDYGMLMRASFNELARVLKPGRWITVEFHNSQNSVWNAIQEGLSAAGFVIADVRTLDKQKGTTKQLSYTAAVKQDLVISAYKPAGDFNHRFKLESGTEEGAWDFVLQHLTRLPSSVEKGGVLEPVAERQPFLLFDRMVAFHVQRGATVPLSAAAFYKGLRERFVERDGMVFLPEQVPEYEAARLRAERLGQLALFVSDEKSSIQWLRQVLEPATGGRPQTYQEILPQFLRQLHQARHEQLPELGEMLDQNFLQDPREKWYVPDPNRAEDLERLRRNALLREFNGYLEGRGRLRAFRTEAVRAGFAEAYRRGEYAAIVKLAERLPEAVLQEDPDLLMYYDNASLRVG